MSLNTLGPESPRLAADVPSVDAVPVGAVPADATMERSLSGNRGKLDPLIRDFLHSFHVLLRSVRLYHRNHPQVTESLDSSARHLAAVLSQVPALCLKLDRDGITATTREAPRTTRPLTDYRGELKTLSAELGQAGVTSLIFLRRVNPGELALFAHALNEASRDAARLSGGRGTADHDWAKWIAQHQSFGIQINASEEYGEETVLALLLTALPEPSAGNSPAPITGTGDEVRAALLFASALAAPLERAQNAPTEEAARAVRTQLASTSPQTLALLAQATRRDPPLDADLPAPYLGRLQDAIAVEFVLSEYRAGRLTAADVRPLFAALEDRSRPDFEQETRTEARIERFWTALPARAITGVLEGPEAWCLPVGVLRGYLTTLLLAAERRHAQASASRARRCLAAFVRCFTSERATIRRAVAATLVEVSDLVGRMWPHADLAEMQPALVSAFSRETSPAVSVLLASAIETLARISLEKRCYGEFEKIVSALDAVPAGNCEGVQPLLGRLFDSQFWLPLVDAALSGRPLDPALPRLLQRDPPRLLDRLGLLLSGPQGASALPSMARLLRASGDILFRAVETDLSGMRRQRVAVAIKLLSSAAPERLAAALPRVMSGWDWSLQDLAVTELAHQPHADLQQEVAQVFIGLLNTAHLHVIPCMIDLIILAGEDSAAPRLLEMAAGDIYAAQDSFVRIKAIEALGRLLATSAVPRLRELATKRSGLSYAYPPGLRAAAAEALELIESNGPGALHIAPGCSDQQAPFSRPRRYRRVALSSPLAASIEGVQSSPARVRAIALGGALVETSSKLAVGDSMRLEIHAGLGRVRSTAVVRNSTPDGYGVEFVHMEEDDREKLRRRMSKLLQ